MRRSKAEMCLLKDMTGVGKQALNRPHNPLPPEALQAAPWSLRALPNAAQKLSPPYIGRQKPV